MLSKKAVIIVSNSGCGKTTTIVPKLMKALPASDSDCGNIAKALIGISMLNGKLTDTPELSEIVLASSGQALTRFIYSGRMQAGISEYEKRKATGEYSGYSAIEFFELWRCIFPTIHEKSSYMLAYAQLEKVTITSAHNQKGLNNLLAYFGAANCVILRLHCKDAKKRQGDNRTSDIDILPTLPNVVFTYNLEELDSLVNSMIVNVKILLGDLHSK